MAKRGERKELRLDVVTPWVVLVFIPLSFLLRIVFWGYFNPEVPAFKVISWAIEAPIIAIIVWRLMVGIDYRSYAKRMLPLVNGCPNHPSYQGRGDVKGYSCPTCAAIRYARLSLFPEERRS